MNDNRAGIEIDLQKLLLAYLRKWWLIVVCVVVAALGALYITSQFITPMYQASVTVYVNSVKSDQQINSISSSSLATSQRLVSTYVNMIKSDTVLTKVAEATDTNITAADIRRAMSASQVEETELFKVFITHADPEIAAHIANAVADVAPGEIENFVEGSSAKIIDYAKVPTSPASPNVMRNCVLGALAGFVAAVAYITLRFLLDVRIKDDEDLSALFEIPVLGQIPEFEAVNNKKRSGYGYGKYGYATSSVTKKGDAAK